MYITMFAISKKIFLVYNSIHKRNIRYKIFTSSHVEITPKDLDVSLEN